MGTKLHFAIPKEITDSSCHVRRSFTHQDINFSKLTTINSYRSGFFFSFYFGYNSTRETELARKFIGHELGKWGSIPGVISSHLMDTKSYSMDSSRSVKLTADFYLV
jgi:hypothetical protein